MGLQEKTTFLQLVKKPGVRSAMMQIPGFIQVCMAIFTVLIIYHVVAHGVPRSNHFEPLRLPEQEIPTS